MLRVYSDVLMLSTMLWPDEVRATDFPFLGEEHPQVRPQELAMAATLIDSMSDDVFDPGKYHDTYRAALEELVEAKISGHETIAPTIAAGADEEVADLLAALSASVEQAQKPQGDSGTS